MDLEHLKNQLLADLDSPLTEQERKELGLPFCQDEIDESNWRNGHE